MKKKENKKNQIKINKLMKTLIIRFVTVFQTNLFIYSANLDQFLYLSYMATTIVVLSMILFKRILKRFFEECHFTYNSVLSVSSFVKNFKWV